MSQPLISEALELSIDGEQVELGVFTPQIKEGETSRRIEVHSYLLSSAEEESVSPLTKEFASQKFDQKNRDPFLLPVPWEHEVITGLIKSDPLGVYNFVNPCANIYGVYSASLKDLSRKLGHTLEDWLTRASTYASILYSKDKLANNRLMFPGIDLHPTVSATPDTMRIRSNEKWFAPPIKTATKTAYSRRRKSDTWDNRLIPIFTLPFLLAESRHSRWDMFLLKVVRVMQARVANSNCDPLQKFFYEQTIYNADRVFDDRPGTMTEILNAVRNNLALVTTRIEHASESSLGSSNPVYVPTIGKLFLASKTGDIEQVKTIISKQSDVNEPDEATGLTPLFIASFNGHTEIVRLLLKAGAVVPDAQDLSFKQTTVISKNNLTCRGKVELKTSL